ncbi:phospholipase A1 [Anabrus simplex]|uniref:phospholipase A1 n=1 Tax=Anabrus simplex TaxID=316456 RepID=UPI0035A36F58
MTYVVLVLFVATLVTAQDDPSYQVCYPEVGCFSTGYPWNRTVDRENNTFFTPKIAPPPRSPQELNNSITLFNRKTGFQDGILIYRKQALGNLNQLNIEKKIIMIPHGYDGFINNIFLLDMREAILKKEDVNILMIGWGALTGPDNFAQSVSDIRVVGAEMAGVIETLRQYFNSSLYIELVSLSIGVPLLGYIGKSLKNLEAKPVQLIVGLDPVGIGFEGVPEIRLTNTDAEFVVVVHTDCDVLGTYTRQGDVDFFMNGCVDQPGCQRNGSSVEEHTCSHLKAVEYFTKSLSSDDCELWGQQLYTNPCKGHPSRRPQTSLISACSDNACSSLGDPLILPGRGDIIVDTTKSCSTLENIKLSEYKQARSVACNPTNEFRPRNCTKKCSSEIRNSANNQK